MYGKSELSYTNVSIVFSSSRDFLNFSAKFSSHPIESRTSNWINSTSNDEGIKRLRKFCLPQFGDSSVNSNFHTPPSIYQRSDRTLDFLLRYARMWQASFCWFWSRRCRNKLSVFERFSDLDKTRKFPATDVCSTRQPFCSFFSISSRTILKPANFNSIEVWKVKDSFINNK